MDTDKDGIMDRVDIDTDGDGITDDSFPPIDVSDVKPVGWTFKELNETLAPIFKTEPEHTYNLVMALTTALRSTKEEMEEDAVWDLLANRMQGKIFRTILHVALSTATNPYCTTLRWCRTGRSTG